VNKTWDTQQVAIIGAGVSGLTCGVVFAERGWRVQVFADAIARQTTSGAAAAIWFPYDVEPWDKVIAWSLSTYEKFRELAHETNSGVSFIELHQLSRAGEIAIPPWARNLGARHLAVSELPANFASGFALTVPLTDTSRYLDYLRERFQNLGGAIVQERLRNFSEIPSVFDVVINCAGIGARELAADRDLEPHRGQVVIVRKVDLHRAVVCDDAPLMYAIPRANDCVFGGTNEISDDLSSSPTQTRAIINECSRVFGIESPPILSERVGLRPFRKSGVRLERERLSNGPILIHNYGHGGAGFTLSWGCAEEVLALASPAAKALG
jgi:D-amino-acid oxidase